MGAVQGHMSHLYDNPNLKFSQIKDVFQKASRGELVGTEKTDGQNIMVSFNVQDNTARASRNKGHFKQGGLTPDELQAFFGDRGELEHSFSDAFRAFEMMASKLPEEAKLKLFGPEANIYYNSEIQDPRTSNVINYDVATLTIHRKGHGEYDKETGNLIQSIPEDSATYLENLLNQAEDTIEGTDYRVQVNAIRQLEKLSNDSALDGALIRLDRFMSANGLSDENTVGEYLVQALEKDIDASIPGINLEAKKLLMKRMFEEGYGTEDKNRKVTQREIINSLEDQELKGQIKPLIVAASGIIKNLIYPLEDIVHDFSVEMLRSLQSAFILDNPGELERQKEEVRKAIEAIESSGNEEAIKILQYQMGKLKNIDKMTTPAEGFVFDYDGHTYKFTGNFAPVNQILGLFKYGREGIPPLQAIDASEILYEKLDYVVTSDKPFVALFPGKFKPPHSGHLGVVKELAANHGVSKVVVMISPRTHDGITAEQSKEIWELFLKGTPMEPKVEVRIPDVVSPVGAVYDYIDEAGSSLPVLLAVGRKDKEDGRYADAIERGATRPQRLNLPPLDVVIDDIPPQAGGVCASDIRKAMAERSEESMKKVRECLPVHISPDDKVKVMKLMEPTEVVPMAETFRSANLYGMIEKILDEQEALNEGTMHPFIPDWLMALAQKRQPDVAGGGTRQAGSRAATDALTLLAMGMPWGQLPKRAKEAYRLYRGWRASRAIDKPQAKTAAETEPMIEPVGGERVGQWRDIEVDPQAGTVTVHAPTGSPLAPKVHTIRRPDITTRGEYPPVKGPEPIIKEQDELDEMSSMGGGSVQGGMIGTGSKAGPWADLDVEEENEKQKKHQKLEGESLAEELIDEVLDYLIHVGV